MTALPTGARPLSKLGAFAPDRVPNRFLHLRDWADPRYAALRDVFDRIYRDELAGEPHPSHARHPEAIVTHWSREWEYPWTVLNAELAPGMHVTDLGCAGSPLLPYLSRRAACVCTGVDLILVSKNGRHNLRGFAAEPATLYPEIAWLLESMDRTSVKSESQDRVLCISVLEHVSPEVAARTLAEIRRTLRPGGLALITTDVGGEHRTLTISFERIIEMARDAGLTLRGRCDWATPDPEDVPGTYNVVGLVLEKRDGKQ